MYRVKRFIALILLICMVMTITSASAYAGDSPEANDDIIENSGDTVEQFPEVCAEPENNEDIYEPENVQLTASLDGEGGTYQAYIMREGAPVYYDTLYSAYSDAQAGETIVLCADAELPNRLSVSKNITITDDGIARSIYCYNTATDKSGGYGRGIQINSGADFSISATAAGNMTIYGHSIDGNTHNAGEIVYVYNGTANLNNLILKDNTEADINAYTDKTRVINLKNITAESITVPAGCSCTLEGKVVSKIDLAAGYNPITISSSLSSESDVTISVDSANVGDTILTGGISSDNSKCFSLVYSSSSSEKPLSIGDDGKIETQKVASYVNSSGNTIKTDTLSDAVSNAKAGTTVTILADCEVSSRILIDKNLSISDNGKHHTIYVYNSDTSKDGGYGRAIQLQNSKTLTVSGTPQGGLTFIGHEKDNSTKNNKSSIIYVYTGTLTINGNVEITDCHTTYGVIYAAKGTSVNLDGCHIHGNVNTHDNGGTAVYNLATLNIKGGTIIEDNSATSAMSGAIYNEVSDSNTAKTHLSGNIIVQNNLKCCTKQENEDVAHDGKLSNIQLSSPDTLVLENDISGNIGIDYSGDENGVFGKTNRKPLSGKDCLSEDGGNYSTVTYDNSSNLYWHFIYSISGGKKTDVSDYSYKLNNASVSLTSVSDKATIISITADCGSFSIPGLPENCTGFIGIKYDGTYTTVFSGADKYRGISVCAELEQSKVRTFIRSITFTTPGEGMKQTVSFGLSADSSASYFGSSYYSFCSGTETYDRAKANTENAGKYLATVTSSVENSYIKNTFGGSGWLGASVQSGMWCWTGGPEEGIVIGGNSSSSEGYNGAYVNWAENEPNGENFCSYMDGTTGKWYSANGTDSLGWYQETHDACAATVTTEMSADGGITRLNAISPSFDGDIGMSYYFSFSDKLLASKDAYITVKVGDGDTEEYKISTIVSGGDINEYGDYGIKVGMAAKQMNDTVEIKIFDGNDNLISSYGGEGRNNYNLRYYATKVIQLQADGGSDKYNENFSYDIVKFVKAMLNYGAAAQVQFNHNISNPANAGVEDGIQTAPATIDDTDEAVYKNDDTAVFVGAALEAESSTVMRVFLGSDDSVSVDGKAYIPQELSGEYYVDIPVNAKNLSHIYSIVSNGKMLQINAYHVINELLSAESTSSQSRLTAYKLYRFGKTADSYFGVRVISSSAVDAVVNTAFAYLNKAQYVQYDQTTIVKTNLRYTNVPNWRRQVRVYPENATGDISNVHMDCSSFIWNVYCDAFGTDNVETTLGIEEYEIDTAELVAVNNETLVREYTLSSQEPTKEEILSILQPGDILVKRRSGHGHVVIWVGNGYIHCTGSSYSYNDSSFTGSDKIESNGAIKYASADTFSEAWWNGFDTLAILRPLNVLDADSLDSYGQARSQLGGITVSKTVFVSGRELYDGLSVRNGDVVTYRITVSNPVNKGQMSATRTVNISDTDPSGEIHVFDGVIINPGDTETVEYEYTVSAVAGTVLLGGSGTLSIAGGQGRKSVDDGRGVIAFSAKSVAVENEVSQDAIDLLIQYATEGQKQYSGILYINDLMTSVTGKPIILAASDSVLFTELFKEVSSSGGTKAKIVNTNMSANTKNNLVSNFASGRMVINHSFNDDNDEFSTCRRVRKIRTENLQIGDIVAVNPTGGTDYIYYVYLGGQSMLTVSGNKATLSEDADTVLDGLLAKYSFAVLRVLGRS